jgi:serine/threonine-protein kinase
MDRKSVEVILDEATEQEAPVVAKRLLPPRPRARLRSVERSDDKPPPTEPRSIKKEISLQVEPDGDGYEDHGEIARGGTAIVRRAFDRRLQRTVALKVLQEKLDPHGVPGLRFVEEAQITGQLEHPAIVPVYELVPSDGKRRPQIAMKMVRGKTLRAVLEGLGDERLEPSNLERLVRAISTVCDAVAFANEKGVVHCRLKPDNVMLGRHGQVYLMDFGSAAVAGVTRAQEKNRSTATGTLEYMAPEQVGAFGSAIDARTDVYGIGGLLYFVLTLRPPRERKAEFYETVLAIHDGSVIAPDKLPIGKPLPPELVRIAMRCLARDPAERYPNAAALRDELHEFLRGGGWLHTRRFKAGTVIVREGAVGTEAYVVVNGECETFRTVAGKRKNIGRVGPGEAFGEMAILTSKPRAASVAAKTDVVVKVITAESLERELARSSWVRIVIAALAERAREQLGG